MLTEKKNNVCDKQPFVSVLENIYSQNICSQGNVHFRVGCIFWKMNSTIFQSSKRPYFQQIPRMAVSPAQKPVKEDLLKTATGGVL